MPNDNTISHVASDSTSPILRKKNSPDSIDVSKLSFFDELLSIGQFESTVPEPTTLPAPSTSNDSDSKGTKDSSHDSKPNSREDSDKNSQQPTSQPVVVVQPQQLPQTTEAPKSSKPDALKPRVGNSSKNPKDNSPAVQNADPADAGTKNLADKEVAAPVQQEVQNVQASSTADQAPKNTVDANSKSSRVGDNNHLQSSSAIEASKRDKTPKGTNANQAVDANANQDNANKGTIELNKDLTLNDKQRTTPISELLPNSFRKDLSQQNDNLPRNKRADRLAKQATNEEPSSNDRSNVDDSILTKEPAIHPASVEPSFAENAISVSTTPISSSPTIGIPPTAAPSAFTLSSTGSTSNASSRVIADSNVATAAIRGGIATGNASASHAVQSSNGSPTARADQGRTEVARSNSGTQITAYQEGKLVQRVLRGVEQLANGGGQVRLRLHPPELGSLQMSLRMEAGQVFAKLEVENSTAKEALLNNVQTLKDRMAEQGMKVAAFEVEVSTDSSGSGTGSSNLQNNNGSGQESRWENPKSRFVQQNENRLSSEPVASERKTGAKWSRTNGSLDLTV